MPGETSPGLTVKVSFRAHSKKSITKRNAFLFNGRRGEGANKLKPGVQGQVSRGKGCKRVKNAGSGEKRKRGLIKIHGMSKKGGLSGSRNFAISNCNENQLA